MSKKIILIFTAVFFAALPAGVLAGSAMLGGAFADTGISTRPMSMGGAYTALADDANASWWNPAGLALLGKEKSVSFTYIPDLYKLTTGKISRMMVSYGQGDTSGFGGLGGSISYFDASFGSDYTGDYDYSWAEYVALLSWGMQVDKYLGMIKYKYPKIAVGVNIKYMGVDNDFEVGGSSNNASGFSGDVSVLMAFKENLNIGIAARNIYSRINWETGESERLPYSINGGAYYGITDDFLIIGEIKAVENDSGKPEINYYCAGTEYNIKFGKNAQIQEVSVRAGLTIDPLNDSYIIAAGPGIMMEGFSIDYAYQYYIKSELNNSTHRLGLTAFFK